MRAAAVATPAAIASRAPGTRRPGEPAGRSRRPPAPGHRRPPEGTAPQSPVLTATNALLPPLRTSSITTSPLR